MFSELPRGRAQLTFNELIMTAIGLDANPFVTTTNVLAPGSQGFSTSGQFGPGVMSKRGIKLGGRQDGPVVGVRPHTVCVHKNVAVIRTIG